MKKYIVIYHAPADSWDANAQATEEEMKKGMEQWMVWAEKCGDKLIDMGTPLAGGVRLNPDGSSTVSDKDVLGYSILGAENMEEAKSLLKDHPHLNWNSACSIEVHESMPTPGS